MLNVSIIHLHRSYYLIAERNAEAAKPATANGGNMFGSPTPGQPVSQRPPTAPTQIPRPATSTPTKVALPRHQQVPISA